MGRRAALKPAAHAQGEANTMPIKTERLILRIFSGDDFEALRELDADPQVLSYRSRQPITPEQTRKFLERAQQSVHERLRIYYAYAVVLQENSRWLGQCGLTVLTRDLSEAFVWYALLPRHWGQGYMSEAVQALLYVAVTRFKLRRIIAECRPDNAASIRVMEKAGMSFAGRVQFPTSGGGSGECIRYRFEAQNLSTPGPAHLVVEPPV
jgi:[ribosomal protein S5]-alanine N-acetyltransferase